MKRLFLIAGFSFVALSSSNFGKVFGYGNVTHAQVGVHDLFENNSVWKEIKNVLETKWELDLGNMDAWPGEAGAKAKVLRELRFRNAFAYGCNAPDADKIPNKGLNTYDKRQKFQTLTILFDKKGDLNYLSL